MVLDARGFEITCDLYVRYLDTGTIGKIIDIKHENNSDWVKLDKTELWYRSNLVVLLDEKDIKKSTYFDNDFNDEIDIEAMKEKASSLENIELDSNVAEGGG